VALEKLIKFYENDQLAKKDPTLGILRLASWYSALGFAQVCRKQFKAGRVNTLKALEMVGIVWPKTPNEYELSIIKNTRLAKTLWLKTLGGRIRISSSSDSRASIIFRCLPIIREIAMYDASVPQHDLALFTLVYLNHTIVHGSKHRAEFVKACFRAAQWYWLSDNRPYSRVYMQQALKFIPKNDNIETHFLAPSHVFIYQGKFEKAINFLKRCSSRSLEVGDVVTYNSK
jgi:hypothetical protein